MGPAHIVKRSIKSLQHGQNMRPFDLDFQSRQSRRVDFLGLYFIPGHERAI